MIYSYAFFTCFFGFDPCMFKHVQTLFLKTNFGWIDIHSHSGCRTGFDELFTVVLRPNHPRKEGEEANLLEVARG